MTARSVERTFAFVDLSGFTALTEAHGDEEAVATLNRFREITENALGPEDVLVKTIGDAVMLTFATPALAVAALHRLFDEVHSDASMLLIRAGVHSGSAILDGNDYFGGAVNLAARVAAHAGEGQLLVTKAIANAATETGEVITFVGAVSLRNIAEPVELYEIEVNTQSSTAVDPVCAMKVPTTGPSTVHLRYSDHDLWFCGLPCLARYAAAPDAFTKPSGAT